MYIVVDIGGTKTRIASAANLRSFHEPHIIDTPSGEEAMIEGISGAIREVSRGEQIEAIMVGKPMWAHLPEFQQKLRKRLDAPVYFENDTALVGLGEAHHGAGKRSEIFVYVTISTGVNGVRIIRGTIDISEQGFEIGGQYLATESTVSLEDLISGSAVQKHYGVHPRELPKDHPVWEEEARVLAYGLHNTILHWSPDRIALGGSMMKEIGIPLERVTYHLGLIMKKFPALPVVVHSELGDLGGLWGGLVRLKQLNL